ncbi:MAG: serine/threonine protein kinase [Myxococcales bacterium]|nr:serine/threonine protein kinase [Myxococcales bacterium]
MSGLSRLGPATIVSRYRLDETLWSAQREALHRAYDQSTQRFVALRFVEPPHHTRERHRSMADVILERTRSLDHRNILRVLDGGIDEEDRLFLVHDLVDIRPLSNWAGAPLHEDRICEVGAQVSRALEAAHGRGVVHGDLTPRRIWLERVPLSLERRVVVSDFGWWAGPHSEDAWSAGGLFRDPAYVSPEEVRGEPPSGRSDIYALGLILWELCHGRVPFDAREPVTILKSHLSGLQVNLHLVRRDLPRDLADLITAMLSTRSDDRPSAGRHPAFARRRRTTAARDETRTGGELTRPRT